MRRLAVAVPLLLLAAGPNAAAQAAQSDICNLIESAQVDRDVLSGTIHIQGPFLFRCESGAELRALDGTLNEPNRELTLTGDVFFQDPDQTLTADRATYSSSIARLYATGDVVFVNRAEGSTLRGPELEYFREMEGRPVSQVNAFQRPHLTVRPADAAEDAEPLEIDADRLNIAGQSDLSAFGDVVIHRSDLDAASREARYDSDTGSLELRGGATIVSEEFSLGGEVVQADLVDGALRHVQARTAASLQGSDLTVTAPELQMFFANELLERAVARGAAEGGERPMAVAKGFRLEADSIDAVTPGQRLDQVVAIGAARGETVDTATADELLADSLVVDTLTTDTAGLAERARALAAAADSARSMADSVLAAAGADSLSMGPLVESDWIVGDTLVGYFAPPDPVAAAGDSAAADTVAVLKRIVARGSARSLYRVQPPDTAAATTRRGLNFLAGETIELLFAAGQLETANVTGLRRGVYLDPVVATAAPPDSTGGTPPPPPPVRRDGGLR